MKETLRTLAIIVGLGLAYNGYVAGKTDDPIPPGPVTPDNPDPPGPVAPIDPRTVTIKIESSVDRIPPPPSNPQVLTASLPIKNILLQNPLDALKLARTFAGWSELIARSTALKTTQEFQNTDREAMVILLTRHALAGKYALTQPINEVMLAAFGSVGLVDPDRTIKATDWSPAAASAAAAAYDAISYQCYQAFREGSLR